MADEEKPGQTLFQHGEWLVLGQEGETAKGHAANFPGTVTAWEWSEPADWPDYVLHLAGLAYRRRLLNDSIGEMGVAALRMLSSRLLGEIIGLENFTQVVADAAREFELDPNRLVYWLSAVGLILLGRETASTDDVQRVTVVTEDVIRKLLAEKDFAPKTANE